MEAYEYIRKVKGRPQTESITDLSYSLSIEEVIELMDGYKAVKNNVGLADVSNSYSAEEILDMIVGGIDASPSVPSKNFKSWMVVDEERDTYLINMLKTWKCNNR